MLVPKTRKLFALGFLRHLHHPTQKLAFQRLIHQQEIWGIRLNSFTLAYQLLPVPQKAPVHSLAVHMQQELAASVESAHLFGER